MTTTTKLLEIGAVHKSYGAVTVLGGINLNVAAGSRTAIVGPSGSGKTTLLRIIAGFEVPDAGTVTLGDKRMANGPDAVPAHQRGIGFVPQDGALFPHLNVADNVGFGLPRSMPGRAERIAELMDMVSLDTAMLTRRPHELSGGQQQRVALARALAQRPRLMLLDEPFSALDTGLRAATRKAVAQLLTTAGITTILVTHDQSEALSFADQVAVMRAGKLVQVGAPIEVYLRPHDPVTASFLGDCIVLPAQVSLQQGAPWADCVLGRIPVGADTLTQGAAQIMLRPEQLQVEAVPAAQALASNLADGACYGEVVQADFGGAVCTLSVRLLGAAASTPVLDMQCPGIHAPPAGATVRITVSGAGHVFSQNVGV